MKKTFVLILASFVAFTVTAQITDPGDLRYTGPPPESNGGGGAPEGPGASNCLQTTVGWNQPSNVPLESGWNSNVVIGSGQIIANDFDFPSATSVNSVCWSGAFNTPSSGNAGSTFEITYYSDNAGLPGSIIGGPFIVSPTTSSTGMTMNNGSAEQCYFASHAPVSFNGSTTYWISIASTLDRQVNGGNTWVWSNANALKANGVAGFFTTPPTPWQFFPQSGSRDNAFSLGTGAATPVVADVPTVSQWGLILLGLAFLSVAGGILYRRKKKLAIS